MASEGHGMASLAPVPVLRDTCAVTEAQGGGYVLRSCPIHYNHLCSSLTSWATNTVLHVNEVVSCHVSDHQATRSTALCVLLESKRVSFTWWDSVLKDEWQDLDSSTSPSSSITYNLRPFTKTRRPWILLCGLLRASTKTFVPTATCNLLWSPHSRPEGAQALEPD